MSRRNYQSKVAVTLKTTTTDTTSGETGMKSGRTFTLTAEDMQKKKNDVKTRTTLLLSLPDEHQLRFKVKHDDLNQKFLTSLAPEWLMHTIVWRNRSDLDTMSLDDLYNHLRVYESEVQKKTKPNSQNMAFISSAKHNSGNEDGNTACVPTASTNVPTASASVATISQDTACAYIASQSSGSQIKFEDINQIDEDDMEEMDIKWNMALLSMRADKFWKRIGKKISIQGSDVAGFDKSKVKCFNCHKMGHFGRECRALRSQDIERRDNFRQGSKAKEQAPKALMAIDGVGWDWSYMENDKEDHALVTDEEAPTEFALMANTSTESKVFNNSLCSKDCKKNNDSLNRKDGVDGKLAGLLTASKDLDNLIESQRANKNKEGLGYSAIPLPPAQLYSSPKKDLSWTGLLEFKDDTVTEYSRPEPTVESSPDDNKKRNPSVSETVASPIIPKQFVKFVKASDSQSKSKTDETKTPKKPPVKYFPPVNRKFSTGSRNFPTANRKFPTASRKFPTGSTKSPTADMGMKEKAVKPSACWFWKPSQNLSNKGNISYLSDYEPFNGGYMSFGQRGCKITGKRTIKTGKLEFENVYFVKDLNYNLFSVSQICDNKNNVLFTDSRCIVLGRDFKLLDDANILLRTLRQHNMYSIDLNNIVPHRDLTCLVAKASTDECMLWHRRLDHLNFKTMNKLVRHNLVRGLPTKCFENDHTCTACLKGKQHKASCKSKLVNSMTKPLHTLHMDLFGPTSESLKKKRDEGYFIGYSMSSKTFRVFNKRTRRVEENLHVEFLENNAIEKGTKDAASQEVKKDVYSLRYITLPNWAYDALFEFYSTDQMETLTVETPIPTFEDILGVTSNSDESNGVEADISNMTTAITTSPTPILRIHKDHPKSQIIGPVDTPIQTKKKFKQDSGCSRHMTGNISYLSDYEPFDGRYVSFGQGGCKITGKGTIKTGKLEFENVYFMKDLKYNLFSVSQICDNKNRVLFTDSEGKDYA
nr:putative ribonuclease H-like domain-containing protein [Tanacetum cinerariifolium]